MARTRIRHAFEATSSLVSINATQPNAAYVELHVDDEERRHYQAYVFAMTRSVLEDLKRAIERELRATPLRARKPKASP